MIDTFANNTTTPKNTWQDEALTVLHSNPIVVDSAGRWPSIFGNDSDVFSLRFRDSSGAVVVGTIDNYSGVSEFSLTSADVQSALAANTGPVDLAGSSMIGSAFANFADNLDLTAAGSIDTTLGTITVGTVSGNPVFGNITTQSINATAADFTGIVQKSGTHPTFQAIPTTQNNVTGNSTNYTVTWDIETFDQGSNFDGVSTFTAPAAGKYLFNITLTMSGQTAAATTGELNLVTSNRTYFSSNLDDLGTQKTYELSIIADMDLFDTAVVKILGVGEAGNVWDVNTFKSFFSGTLLS